jgi:hypothetical protein
MGKKKQGKDIYETDQVNKKHRGKSKKLEKREKHKKNKKVNKKERHKKRQLEKYIKKVFKDNKKEIDLARLPLDFDEICKQVKKLLAINSSSLEEVPELFQFMEENKQEIDLSELEDKNAQKYIMKLMKQLKVHQNPKNPYSFKLVNKARDGRQKYTTDIEDVIAECLSSYHLLVKALFEYNNYLLNANDPEAEGDNDDGSSGGESDKSEVDHDDQMAVEKKQLENDYELEAIENKLGNNAELINKAFSKIINDNTTTGIADNNIIESEEELVGPPVPKFLESTMNILNETEGFEDIFNKSTTTHRAPKETSRPTNVQGRIEPINKESYDRQIAYERERMKHMQEELEEYEDKYRGTSLLEQHQMKKAKKGGIDSDRHFDREKDLSVVNSKKAVQMISESKGLKGRFEAKEKYQGY